MNNSIFNIKLKEYPIGFIGTCLGAVTLSNVCDALQLTVIKPIFIIIGCLALIAGVYKLIKYPGEIWKEMNNTIVMALYPTSTMLLMNIGAYFIKFNYTLGRTLWFIGLIINIFFVIFFLIRHVLLGFNMKFVLPCWYALLVGVSVSCTTSPQVNAVKLVTPIFYFVVITFFTFLPVVIYRLATLEVPDAQLPFIAIIAAPASLCTISYITLFKNANMSIVMFFFIITLITTVYVYINLPKILSLRFSVAYAALTFPLAVSCVASLKVKAYLLNLGYTAISNVVSQILAVEFFVATVIIGFVLYNFIFNYLFNFRIKKFCK